MPSDKAKTASTDNLSGRIKVSDADAFLRRLQEANVNHYLFRVRPNDKIIQAGKGVKPLTEEGRTALSIDFPTVRNRIKNNVGNYGCYAFPDGLCFLDFDLDPNNPGSLVVPYEKIFEFVETVNTFTVRTRSGGYQFYFKNPGLEDNPHIFYVPPGHQEGEPLIDAGELRCKNQYVVCPGSYVPKDGKKGFTEDANGVYQVVWDAPIQTLDLALFPSWLKTHDPLKDTLQRKQRQNIPKLNLDTTKKIEHVQDSLIINSRGVSLAKIRGRDGTLDDLLEGAGHIMGFRSGSEADESAIFRLLKNNFSDQQVYDIIYTRRYREKMDRPDYLEPSIAHAKAKISSTYDENISANCTGLPQVLVPEIPKNLPSWMVTLLKTFPRSGKTHATIEWAIQSRSANYIAATHETVENALNLFQKISKTNPMANGLLAVHITGKERACNEKNQFENCKTCSKFPNESLENGQIGTTFMDLQSMAHELLREKKVLTVKDIPQEMCPYYTLHLAEKIADLCFTIPYYHHANDKIKSMTPRDLLAIDEDTTSRSFYPVCVELAVEYQTKDGYSIQNSLSGMMWFIYKLEDHLNEKIDKSRRSNQVNENLLHLVQKIKEIHSCLRVGMDDHSPESIAKMHECLNAIDLSNNYNVQFKLKLVNKIAEYARDMGASNSSAAQLFEPLIYPAMSPVPGERSPCLSWIGGRGTPATLFLISEHTLIHVPKFKKLVVIGGTESEIFVKDVVERLDIDKNEVKTVTMQDFKYANNYVFFEIFDPDKASKEQAEDSDEDAVPKIDMDGPATLSAQQYLRKLIYLFSEENRKYLQKTPSLLLTSTIKSQKNIIDWLGGGSIACTDHRMDEIYSNWNQGRINVFYQNSIISRGLDIPFYHTTFVYSCNFATPYWTAIRNHLQELLLKPAEDGADQAAEGEKYNLIREKIDDISRIINKIQLDETTNGLLRTAPVPGRYEDHIKLVIFSERHNSLVAGARCNGTTTIPVSTATPIEPLIGAIMRLIDPVMNPAANPAVRQLTPHAFKPVDVAEAKTLITQYMTNYEDVVETYNLPIEKVGFLILTHPNLIQGRRLSETALINVLLELTRHHIGKKTLQKVIMKMLEANLLKSSLSSSGELHRMYHINEVFLASLSDEKTRDELIRARLLAI